METLLNTEFWNAAGNNVLVAELEGGLALEQNLTQEFRKQVATLLSESSADTMMLRGRLLAEGTVVRVLEADLSESNMCGNGIRALHASTRQSKGVYITRAGHIFCETLENGKVRVNMGLSNYHGRLNHVGLDVELLDVGEPHAVFVVGNIEEADDIFNRFGMKFVNSPVSVIDSTVNLNVVEINSRQEITLRTFERGVNRETDACGTGATCAFSYLLAQNLLDDSCRVNVNGGVLNLEKINEKFYKTGPAELVR